MSSLEKTESRTRNGQRARSKSVFKRKITSSYRNMGSSSGNSDSESSYSSCGRSSSSSNCRSQSRSQRHEITPPVSKSPQLPPKRSSKNKSERPKFAVARSKHMKRIKYALSPVSGRKLFPLEPSKTNQPTYASSGLQGCRMTSTGIKYTFLLDKVLQGSFTEIFLKNCSVFL